MHSPVRDMSNVENMVEQVMSSQEQQASSPLHSSSRGSTRPRKPPTVTPRRFTRFWTPRTSKQNGHSSRTGRQLRDITGSALNRGTAELGFDDIPALHPTKRRRTSSALDCDLSTTPASSAPVSSSPPPSSPCDRPLHASPIRLSKARRAQALQSYPDWRMLVDGFYTGTRDKFDMLDQGHVPFCTTACHTNSLIAIGNEAGSVDLLDTAQNSKTAFEKPVLTADLHANAVMDLDFSYDDQLLATASGDQSICVMDLFKHQVLHTLSAHTSSVKRVTFQPGSRDVLATCGRDGLVCVWDLRCQGRGPRKSFTTAQPAPAHTRPGSATSLLFLANGSSTANPYHLLTASDMDATLQLWDLRLYSSQSSSTLSKTRPTPLVATSPPAYHRRHRRYGITSLALSHGGREGNRLYAVCCDDEIHVYAPSQLFGHPPPHAPRLNSNTLTKGGLTSSRSEVNHNMEDETQPSSLYSLTHPSLRVNSFYVRCSIRQPREDRASLLAVGSGTGTPIIFPTDERVLFRENKSDATFSDGMLRCYKGARLMGGHNDKLEATGVAWSHNGALVSIGDDLSARCWRESNETGLTSSALRKKQGKSKRSMCGWADVDDPRREKDDEMWDYSDG